MAIPFHKDITNFEGLRKTLKNDKYTYRWFLYLFHHPNFIGYTVLPSEVEGRFPELDRYDRQLWLYHASVFLFFAAAALTRNMYFIGGALISFGLFLKVLRGKHVCVGEMAMALIQSDFDEKTIGKKTLYQLGEFYAQKYNVISLVDAIYGQDKIYRATLLMTFIFSCYILLVDFWWLQYLIMFTLFLIIGVIANTPYFYKRLK